MRVSLTTATLLLGCDKMPSCLHSKLDDSTTDDLSGKQFIATVDWDNTLVESLPTVSNIWM